MHIRSSGRALTWAIHFVNWMLLMGGLGLLLDRLDIRPRCLFVLLITGVGSMFAIGWEVSEWYTFIRRGTELDGAYQDTLSDELFGTLGALLAGLAVERRTPVGHPVFTQLTPSSPVDSPL